MKMLMMNNRSAGEEALSDRKHGAMKEEQDGMGMGPMMGKDNSAMGGMAHRADHHQLLKRIKIIKIWILSISSDQISQVSPFLAMNGLFNFLI